MKPTELADMDKVYGGQGDVNTLKQPRKYLQVSSALSSTAARTAEYDDKDLRDLHTRAGDYVSVMRVRCAYHSIRQLAISTLAR